MRKDLIRRLEALEATAAQLGASPSMAGDPDLAEVYATTAFAREAFGSPNASGADCHARLFGLRGSKSLNPWLKEGVNDVAQLARRDFEEEFGEDWQAEWERRQEEGFALLEGRFGKDWSELLATRLATARQGAMTFCRQNNDLAGRMSGQPTHETTEEVLWSAAR